jgi:ribosomal protein S18 acetylase RimI-like enzyme
MNVVIGYEIEPAGWRDLGDLHHLEVECFGEDAWSLWDLISLLTTPGVVRLKAVAEDKMIAFIGGDPHPDEKTGWITTIGVLPQFRRNGIARALLEKCELDMDMRFVRLCVRRTNLTAQELYRWAGYQQVAVWPKYYRSGEDALVMQKDRITVQNYK